MKVASQERHRSRWQVASQNILGTSAMRIRDLNNIKEAVWATLALPRIPTSYNKLFMVYEILTRLQISYYPAALTGPTPRRTPPAGMAERKSSSLRVMHFADSMGHVSGVDTTMRQWQQQAEARGEERIMVGCGKEGSDTENVTINLPALGCMTLGDYDNMNMFVPEYSMVVDLLNDHQPDVVHISTPGPLGLMATAAAKGMGIPLVGTYHTDFPSYARMLTGHDSFYEPARQFMIWFYKLMDRVAAPSRSTRDELIDMGLKPEKLDVVGRGVDTSRFNPGLKSDTLKQHFPDSIKHLLLYVGRISEEKNLSMLSDAFKTLSAQRPDVGLVMVGDGPFKANMQAQLKDCPAHFTGTLKGQALADVYASADLFVFPSMTDTFGVVLIEAQASGLPVIVGDRGGPRDCMAHGRTGWMVDNMTADRLSSVIDYALTLPETFTTMKTEAREFATGFTPAVSFEAYWQTNVQAWTDTYSMERSAL